MTEIWDAVCVMEDRKKSAGLYETRGVVVSDDQMRMTWMSLDVDIEELADAADRYSYMVVAALHYVMRHGMPPQEFFKSLWADAFMLGVLYERMRSEENGIGS